MQPVSKRSPQSHRNNIGKVGEDIAARYLLSHRYLLVERNFRIRYGEIDIIAREKETLVFVEVKTRVGNVYGTPEEAVTPRKLQEVVRTGEYYRLQHPDGSKSYRVDVISLTLAPETLHIVRFRHIRNVTL